MSGHEYRILLIEDGEPMVTTSQSLLAAQYSLSVAESVADARALVRAQWPDLVLLDLGPPAEHRMSLLRELRQQDPNLDVVVIAGSHSIKTAVNVMKSGARDYLQKPFEEEDLLLCVGQAHEHWKLRDEARGLRTELSDPFYFESIVAASPKMKSVLSLAVKMAQSQVNVLITGPSGTGKELIARAIHCDGVRHNGPFIAVNCAQFSASLLESELFGHERGAFTGATARRRGRFELANRGTLFLDEIGNTSLEMQAKILRVVETKRFERVGGEAPVETDFRLLAATNACLEDRIEEGAFREDLFYRLNVVRIDIPPLSERTDDIEPLCQHFIVKHCGEMGRTFRGITPEAMRLLKHHSWKGNVRELENVIQMALALEDGEWITSRYFPPGFWTGVADPETEGFRARNVLEKAIESFERHFLEEQLRLHGGNHRDTARALGAHRNTIEKKIKKYGIRVPK